VPVEEAVGDTGAFLRRAFLTDGTVRDRGGFLTGRVLPLEQALLARQKMTSGGTPCRRSSFKIRSDGDRTCIGA
jgi:hypothetical protein